MNELIPVKTQSTGSDAADFMTFMRAYQDMVFSTAVRLTGNDAQAEDISQEVFLRAYEHFADLRVNPAAGGWLKTVATNLSLNHLTRYRKRWRLFSELRDEKAAEFADDDPEAATDMNWQVPDTLLGEFAAGQHRGLIHDAMRQLPQSQRLALALYHFEDMSYQEIADKLRISLSKVKTDIRRARGALLPVLAAAGVVGE